MPPVHTSGSLVQTRLARQGVVLFDVPTARELAARCRRLNPGARISRQRSWLDDPGETRDGLFARLAGFAGRRRHPPAPPKTRLWFWESGEEELLAQANIILLRFVHPLVARGLPYCIGFPFSSTVFERQPLSLAERARLDLEDIGVLLREGGRSVPPLPARDPGKTAVRLDAAQRAAVEHVHGAARVLAPAGSGKTKTLVSRVFELVARGADPARILLLAFNTKAAAQLEERLEEHGIVTTRRIGLDASSSAVHCATFNAFGARYQREIMRARTEVDTHVTGRRAMMKQAMEAAGFGLATLKPARGTDPVGAFLAALTRVRAGLENPESIAVRVASTGDQPTLTVPFAAVHARYSQFQAISGRQSFDDQIYLAVADMLATPERRRCIQERYDHVLVDEFQDLNGAQLALVDLLSRPHRNLFVVGDDDQHIYGWRFADPSGILRFHEHLPPRPWSATYSLSTNYRCSRAVVAAAARLVANNVMREAKNVQPRVGAQEGAVLFAAAPTWAERGAAICAFLRSEKSRLGCAWRDLAVLSRYRSQQLAVALALDADGVPRTPQLGNRLFSHPAAKLLRAYIDLIRAPSKARGDDLRLLLNHSNRHQRTAHVAAIAAAAHPWARLVGLASSEPVSSPRPLSALVERIEALSAELHAGLGSAPATPSAAPGFTAAQLLSAVVDGFGLDNCWQRTWADSQLAQDDAGGPTDDASRDNAGPFQVLDALMLLAETFPAPAHYLAAWDGLRAAEEAGSDMANDTLAREQGATDRVVVSTIHSAKGREYRAVVIPDYDCDVTRWSPSDVEEERRVVYVGVTRARDSVLLTVDASRPYVHPFLRELVEAPLPGEHAALLARLKQEEDLDLRTRLRRRVAEIEVLFPERVLSCNATRSPADS